MEKLFYYFCMSSTEEEVHLYLSLGTSRVLCDGCDKTLGISETKMKYHLDIPGSESIYYGMCINPVPIHCYESYYHHNKGDYDFCHDCICDQNKKDYYIVSDIDAGNKIHDFEQKLLKNDDFIQDKEMKSFIMSIIKSANKISQ